MYLHIRKYQLVNARWRDVIDLTDYEETIRQVVGTLFGNDFIEVSVETNCFTLTVNSTSSKIPHGILVNWICPYISRHLLSLNPLLACCRRYSRGER